ncbi:hypothetical protein FB451DRAFT_1162061 [Mycena latifolia]|nr:hypothetical protein FB451DRAFT_1162061 [Mycena latifolia]
MLPSSRGYQHWYAHNSAAASGFLGVCCGFSSEPLIAGLRNRRKSTSTNWLPSEPSFRLSTYFPKVNILYISGVGTCYYCMWAYMESSRLYKEAVSRGEKVRLTKFKLVEEGNHFLHYDFPDLLLREIVQGCKI